MEGLKTWLTAMTCTAMIAAIAVALTPEGFSRKVAKFTGGLLLLLAVMGPVKDMDLGDLADSLAKYRQEQTGAVEAMAVENDEARKAIIAQQTAAYISDKAKLLGLEDVKVRVNCRLTEEGFPAPEEVYVSAQGEEEAWRALSQAICGDFAIEEDGLTLERTEGT